MTSSSSPPGATRAAARQANAGSVLTKALERAANELGLSQKDLSAILGVSEASVSRLRRSRQLDPRSKEGELALLLLRVWRSLDALVGSQPSQARAWLHAHNHHLDAVPASLLTSITGVMHVAEYLDGMRGRL